MQTSAVWIILATSNIIVFALKTVPDSEKRKRCGEILLVQVEFHSFLNYLLAT